MSLIESTPGADSAPESRPDPKIQLGLVASTALIVGSIIGVGVFSLPYALSAYGPISLVAMGMATVGALALALLFAALTRLIPAEGGPYAYARAAFGNAVGFGNAWTYWITAWAGNAAIAVGWVYYVEHFINKGGSTFWSIVIALVGLWVPAAVNLTGLKNVGSFQVVTTVLKFLPLLLVATVGLFFIKSANFTPWNVSGDSTWSAIGGAMAICLFSYLGVETAAVAAADVRDPERNVPRATIMGTSASAVVYLLSMVAIFGMISTQDLSSDANKASYSVAADHIFGGGWAGNLVAIAVIISGLGALTGWTLICAEMPRAAAHDGLFPERFARESRRKVPAFGIISSTALASLAVIISFMGASGATVFTTLVLMSGITAAVPYAFSALAQLVWTVRDRRTTQSRQQRSRTIRDMLVAVLALVFSAAFIYYSRNTGADWYVIWGPFLMTAGALALGIPVYAVQRKHMLAPDPVGPATAGSL
ncbi:amino acid permease [Williamsia sp. R60]